MSDWTEKQWEAFHNVPCPDEEERVIDTVFVCTTLFGVPEGETGVRLPPATTDGQEHR